MTWRQAPSPRRPKAYSQRASCTVSRWRPPAPHQPVAQTSAGDPASGRCARAADVRQRAVGPGREHSAPSSSGPVRRAEQGGLRGRIDLGRVQTVPSPSRGVGGAKRRPRVPRSWERWASAGSAPPRTSTSRQFETDRAGHAQDTVRSAVARRSPDRVVSATPMNHRNAIPANGTMFRRPHRCPAPRIGQPCSGDLGTSGDREPEQDERGHQEHGKDDPGERGRAGRSQRAPGPQRVRNDRALGHRGRPFRGWRLRHPLP